MDRPIKLRIDKQSQDNFPLSFLGYQVDGRQVPAPFNIWFAALKEGTVVVGELWKKDTGCYAFSQGTTQAPSST